MAVAYNPQILPHGLVFLFDAANRKCISPLGCTGFNTAPQLVRNLMSPSDVINSYNGVKLGNLSYYTVFAIDYPESSYGGDAASREGITPGYNVRSGTKTFDFDRALHYAVYNNSTQSWVKTTIYDTYAYASEVDRFVTEYATAVAAYPDAVHIVAGSHRDSYHNTAQYNILRDLGAPSNVDSIIGFSSPEWILVGKPGLGAGNAYGWVFQNYLTNPDQVAHLNFGLPIYGDTGNYLEFDGSDDFITTSNTTIAGSQTFSVWMSVGTTTPNAPAGVLTQHNYSSTANFGINHIGGNRLAASIGYTNGSREYADKYTTFAPTVNIIFNAVLVYNAGENKIYWYINGSLDSSYTLPATPKSTNYPICLGRWDAGYGDYYFNGKVYSGNIYNRALTAAEIQQNYNALKGRYIINIVTDGLVLNLDAGSSGGYSGTTWKDLSGVIGDVNIQNRSTDWSFQTDSSSGQVCLYNDSNRVSNPGINIPVNNGFNKLEGTIDMWLKPTSHTGGIGWFNNSDGNGSTNAGNWFWIGTWDTSNVLYFRQGNPSTCCNDLTISSFTNAYPLNTWQHWSITWKVSAGYAAIYKNGVLQTSTTGLPTNIPNTNPTNTGQLFNGHERSDNMQFRGYCNAYKIYNRALTAVEIQQNFNALRGRFSI